jgi:hypothetical protein
MLDEKGGEPGGKQPTKGYVVILQVLSAYAASAKSTDAGRFSAAGEPSQIAGERVKASRNIIEIGSWAECLSTPAENPISSALVVSFDATTAHHELKIAATADPNGKGCMVSL